MNYTQINYHQMKNNFSDETIQKIISIIRYHIDNKLPFALIRYGDGEMDILKETKLTHIILWRFKELFNYIPSEDYLLKFQKEFKESCSHSDINVFQTSDNIRWGSKWFYDMMCDNIIDKKSIKIPIKITNKLFGNIGCQSPSLLHKIIKPGEDVVLITCRMESKEVLQRLTGANIHKIIKIPSEAKFRNSFQDNDKTSQLPDRIDEIINNEIPKYIKPGTIVLLGTGPTKPMYCKAIKKYGGIALDLGSSLDGMSGYCTRGRNKGKKNNIVMQ